MNPNQSTTALVVLGAVMVWDSSRQRWTFPTIIHRYSGKLVMGKARALAARHIANNFPVVLVTGGSDTNPQTGKTASRAEQLAKLLVERYEVPAEKVVIVGKKGDSTTQGNVANVVAHLTAHPEIKQISVLSPRFQLERAKLMFSGDPFFQARRVSLEWIVVEEVLAERHRLYRRWDDVVYRTPEAAICAESEKRGIADLKSGLYRSS